MPGFFSDELKKEIDESCDKMLRFEDDHAVQFAEIKANYELLDNFVDIYNEVNNTLKGLLQMKIELKDGINNYEALSKNTVESEEETENHKIVRINLTNAMYSLNDGFQWVSRSLTENDFEPNEFTKQMKQTTRNLEDQISKINKGMENVKSEEIAKKEVKETKKSKKRPAHTKNKVKIEVVLASVMENNKNGTATETSNKDKTKDRATAKSKVEPVVESIGAQNSNVAVYDKVDLERVSVAAILNKQDERQNYVEQRVKTIAPAVEAAKTKDETKTADKENLDSTAIAPVVMIPVTAPFNVRERNIAPKPPIEAVKMAPASINKKDGAASQFNWVDILLIFVFALITVLITVFTN